MSLKHDNSHGAHSSQAQNHDKCEDINHEERFYRVYADIGEHILAFLSGEVFLIIARRIGLLARATFLPDSGTGNAYALAAAMNMSEGGFQQLADRRHVPRVKPGDERLFRFGDIPKTWDAPTTPPTDGETKHGRCATKKPRVSQGKTQGKK